MTATSKEKRNAKILNAPNQISLVRLALSVVAFVLIPLEKYLAAMIFFVLAAGTDWIDGYLARKTNQVTQFGRILDPLADKVLICGTFIFLSAEYGSFIEPWMAVVVVCRELVVTVLRSFLEQHGADFSAKWSGKLKMLFQCIAAAASLLALYFGARGDAPPPWLVWILVPAVWLAVISTIYSGVVYVFAAARLLKNLQLAGPFPLESRSQMSAMLAGVLLLILIGPVIAGSLAGWYWAFRTSRRGNRLLPIEPRRLVPWGLTDLVIMLAAAVTIQVATQVAARQLFGFPLDADAGRMTPAQWAVVLVASSCGGLFTLAAAVLLVCRRVGAGARDLGIDPDKLSADLRLGTVAFVMLALPVFTIQFVLTTVWQPTTHPLVQMMLNDPQPIVVFAGALAAVVVAPVVEEYLFRVFLQGWLENACTVWKRSRDASPVEFADAKGFLLIGSSGSVPSNISALSDTATESQPGTTLPPSERSAAADVTAHDDSDIHPSGSPATNPYAPPAVADYAHDYDAVPAAEEAGPGWWPIGISAAFFAAADYGHGPDPVPLFFLALGLGYLYQRTHRVVPCIMVHFLVNSFTMLQLLIAIGQSS